MVFTSINQWKEPAINLETTRSWARLPSFGSAMDVYRPEFTIETCSVKTFSMSHSNNRSELEMDPEVHNRGPIDDSNNEGPLPGDKVP